MKIEKIPFFILIGFNILTVGLYALQPFTLNNGNYWFTLFYLFLCILFLYLGIKKGRSCSSDSFKNVKCNLFNPRLFRFIFIFYTLTFLIRYSYELYCPLYDINSIVNRIILGILDPKLGYSLKGVRQVPWSLHFLVSIIDNVFFIWGLLSWRYMKTIYKVVFPLFCLFEIMYWFGKGTNFGVMIMISSILFTILISNRNIERLRFNRIILYSLGIIILFGAVISVFSHNMEARSGGDFESVNTDLVTVANGSVDYNNIVLKLLPERFLTLYLYVMSYITQGYYAFSYIFDCSFHWCYGIGNNPAIMSFGELFGFDVEPNSYQKQIETLFGIDRFTCWHSFYLWMANDVSLLGVPLIVFLIGRFTGVAYRLFREKDDFLSGVVFVIFANMIMMFFANNNYLSSVFYSFMFIFPYWYVTRYSKI